MKDVFAKRGKRQGFDKPHYFLMTDEGEKKYSKCKPDCLEIDTAKTDLLIVFNSFRNAKVNSAFVSIFRNICKFSFKMCILKMRS